MHNPFKKKPIEVEPAATVIPTNPGEPVRLVSQDELWAAFNTVIDQPDIDTLSNRGLLKRLRNAMEDQFNDQTTTN